ncbi:MAG: replication restart helicase PriA [Candidatus Muiribacteriota bacterium]
MIKYASVIINLPFDKIFIYKFNSDELKLKKNDRVEVPFGNRKVVGIVNEIKSNSAVNYSSLKEINKKFPDFMRITQTQRELAKRIWQYYLCSYSQALFCVAGNLKNVKVNPQKYDSPALNKLLLNKKQNIAIEKIFYDNNNVSLLFGVTGSGKTEVYFSVCERFIKKGAQTLFLLPEIALTPQLVKRFTDRFGKRIAVYNSALSAGKRNFASKSFQQGEVDIIIGTRSAVFLPAKNLGLIIVDEEHEHTFKQQDTPLYDAKKIALWRAELENCKVVLGSATPTVETFTYARNGIYNLISLNKRSDNRKMPDVELIDMGEEKKASRNISRKLFSEIKKALERKEQIILFLNRRGFSTFVLCKSCHKPFKCKNCDVSLIYHKNTQKMKCHYCGYEIKTQKTCQSCGSANFEFLGSGTERVEEELVNLFPAARIKRVDRDTSGGKKFAWEFYNDMNNGKIDIVIGTQMIGKGFDFPNVSLVGVLWADFILDFPDIRSAERTSQLLMQVAGRSGRGVDGKVLIQTYAKEHYAVKSALKHNYLYFYGEEILRRKALKFPPYSNLIRVVFRGKDESKTSKEIEGFARKISGKFDAAEILGPVPAPISFMKGYYRFHLIIKFIKNRKIINKVIKTNLISFKNSKFQVDVDPVDML